MGCSLPFPVSPFTPVIKVAFNEVGLKNMTAWNVHLTGKYVTKGGSDMREAVPRKMEENSMDMLTFLAPGENGMEPRGDSIQLNTQKSEIMKLPIEPVPEPPAIEPAPSIQLAPITPPVSGTLPYTGTDLSFFWILGGALILLGLILILTRVYIRRDLMESDR